MSFPTEIPYTQHIPTQIRDWPHQDTYSDIFFTFSGCRVLPKSFNRDNILHRHTQCDVHRRSSSSPEWPHVLDLGLLKDISSLSKSLDPRTRCGGPSDKCISLAHTSDRLILSHV